MSELDNQTDITKTGPVGLKGLKGINQLRNRAESDAQKLNYMNPTMNKSQNMEIGNSLDKAYNYIKNLSTLNSNDVKMEMSDNPYQPLGQYMSNFPEFGKSKYDKLVQYPSQLFDLNDLRAIEQSNARKVLTFIPKTLETLTSTLILGLPSFVVGAGQMLDQAISGQDQGKDFWQVMSPLWDNPFGKAMQAVDDWTNNTFKDYQTNKQMNTPWYKPSKLLSIDTIGEFVRNAIGFSGGALLSGNIFNAIARTAKISEGLAKMMVAAKEGKSFSQLTKELNEARTIVSNMTDAGKILTRSEKEASALKRLADYTYEITNGSTGTATKIGSMASGSLFSAMNEATVEALNNSNDWSKLQIQKLKDEHEERLAEIQSQYEDPTADKNEISRQEQAEINGYNEGLKEIDKGAQKMGSMDYVFNLPILTLSNIIQFGRIYAGGFSAAKNAAKFLNPGIAHTSEEVVEKTLTPKAILNSFVSATEKGVNITGNLGNYGTKMALWKAHANALLKSYTEGQEEILQQAASDVSGDYYQDRVNEIYHARRDPDSKEDVSKSVMNFWKANAEGFKDTLGESSTWEQFVAGALQGALGLTVPGIMGMTRNAWLGKNKAVGVVGGYIGELRDYKERMKQNQELADHLNKVSPKIKTFLANSVYHSSMQTLKDQDVKNNDKKKFKDHDDSDFIDAYDTFVRAGKEADFISAFAGSLDLSDENISYLQKEAQKYIDGQKQAKTDEEKASLPQSPFITSDGRVMSADDIRKSLQEKYDHYNKLISDYGEAKKQIEYITNNTLSDDQNKELTYAYVHGRALMHRAGELFKDNSVQKVIKLYNDFLAKTIEIAKKNEVGKFSQGYGFVVKTKDPKTNKEETNRIDLSGLTIDDAAKKLFEELPTEISDVKFDGKNNLFVADRQGNPSSRALTKEEIDSIDFGKDSQELSNKQDIPELKDKLHRVEEAAKKKGYKVEITRQEITKMDNLTTTATIYLTKTYNNKDTEYDDVVNKAFTVKLKSGKSIIDVNGLSDADKQNRINELKESIQEQFDKDQKIVQESIHSREQNEIDFKEIQKTLNSTELSDEEKASKSFNLILLNNKQAKKELTLMNRLLGLPGMDKDSLSFLEEQLLKDPNYVEELQKITSTDLMQGFRNIIDLVKNVQESSVFADKYDEFSKNPGNIDKALLEAKKKHLEKLVNKRAKKIAKKLSSVSSVKDLKDRMLNDYLIEDPMVKSKALDELGKQSDDKGLIVKNYKESKDYYNLVSRNIYNSKFGTKEVRNLAAHIYQAHFMNSEDLTELKGNIPGDITSKDGFKDDALTAENEATARYIISNAINKANIEIQFREELAKQKTKEESNNGEKKESNNKQTEQPEDSSADLGFKSLENQKLDLSRNADKIHNLSRALGFINYPDYFLHLDMKDGAFQNIVDGIVKYLKDTNNWKGKELVDTGKAEKEIGEIINNILKTSKAEVNKGQLKTFILALNNNNDINLSDDKSLQSTIISLIGTHFYDPLYKKIMDVLNTNNESLRNQITHPESTSVSKMIITKLIASFVKSHDFSNIKNDYSKSKEFEQYCDLVYDIFTNQEHQETHTQDENNPHEDNPPVSSTQTNEDNNNEVTDNAISEKSTELQQGNQSTTNNDEDLSDRALMNAVPEFRFENFGKYSHINKVLIKFAPGVEGNKSYEKIFKKISSQEVSGGDDKSGRVFTISGYSFMNSGGIFDGDELELIVDNDPETTIEGEPTIYVAYKCKSTDKVKTKSGYIYLGVLYRNKGTVLKDKGPNNFISTLRKQAIDADKNHKPNVKVKVKAVTRGTISSTITVVKDKGESYVFSNLNNLSEVLENDGKQFSTSLKNHVQPIFVLRNNKEEIYTDVNFKPDNSFVSAPGIYLLVPSPYYYAAHPIDNAYSNREFKSNLNRQYVPAKVFVGTLTRDILENHDFIKSKFFTNLMDAIENLAKLQSTGVKGKDFIDAVNMLNNYIYVAALGLKSVKGSSKKYYITTTNGKVVDNTKLDPTSSLCDIRIHYKDVGMKSAVTAPFKTDIEFNKYCSVIDSIVNTTVNDKGDKKYTDRAIDILSQFLYISKDMSVQKAIPFNIDFNKIRTLSIKKNGQSEINKYFNDIIKAGIFQISMDRDSLSESGISTVAVSYVLQATSDPTTKTNDTEVEKEKEKEKDPEPKKIKTDLKKSKKDTTDNEKGINATSVMEKYKAELNILNSYYPGNKFSPTQKLLLHKIIINAINGGTLFIIQDLLDTYKKVLLVESDNIDNFYKAFGLFIRSLNSDKVKEQIKHLTLKHSEEEAYNILASDYKFYMTTCENNPSLYKSSSKELDSNDKERISIYNNINLLLKMIKENPNNFENTFNAISEIECNTTVDPAKTINDVIRDNINSRESEEKIIYSYDYLSPEIKQELANMKISKEDWDKLPSAEKLIRLSCGM